MILDLPKKPDVSSALRYLHIESDRADDLTLALLDKAEAELRRKAVPRATAVETTRETLAPFLSGNDIFRHLEGCDRYVIMGCTLGPQLDMTIRAAGISDMAYAVVLDALASAVIEQAADAFEQAYREKVRKSGRFLTGRYSPGYGDFPLSSQPHLLRVLNAQKEIGLCVTENHLLTPRKSITAVLGTSDHPVKGHLSGCSHCKMKTHCAYRKEGKTCETDI